MVDASKPNAARILKGDRIAPSGNVVPIGSPVWRAKGRQIIAIGGGKGGIGKSFVSANIAVALARLGARVVVVDVDLGGANLHTCLGMGLPKVSISDFIERRVEHLEDVAVPTFQPNLWLISGASDGLDAANPRHAQKSKLLRHLLTLDVDYVILDLGAGTSFNVLDFFTVADQGIVVILPEPTSIENAYRFIKAAFVRSIQAVGLEEDFAGMVAGALAPREMANRRTPWEVVEWLRDTKPENALRLEQVIRDFRPLLVVNQARDRRDFDVGPSVAGAWQKFFGLELQYLGAVSHDDAVWQAVRTRRSVLAAYPDSQAAQGILRIAEKVVALHQ